MSAGAVMGYLFQWSILAGPKNKVTVIHDVYVKGPSFNGNEVSTSDSLAHI